MRVESSILCEGMLSILVGSEYETQIVESYS